MTTESCSLTPSLIDAVHGVVSINRMSAKVDGSPTLTLVAVGLKDDMHLLVTVWSDVHDSTMGRCCQFNTQMFVRQAYGIVMRMRDLAIMAETRGTLFWSSAQLTSEGSDGKRAIILCTSTDYPMRIAHTLP